MKTQVTHKRLVMVIGGVAFLLLLLFLEFWEMGVPAKAQPQSGITRFIALPAPLPPTAVVAVQPLCGSSSATVSWRAPATNGPYTSYTAKTVPLTSSAASVGETISSAVYGYPAPTTAIIVGLEPGTTYIFTVTATNAGGKSIRSLASNPLTVC